ncbi:MAG: hypothetical protein V3W41_16305 [Planctomycetota bacterium]
MSARIPLLWCGLLAWTLGCAPAEEPLPAEAAPIALDSEALPGGRLEMIDGTAVLYLYGSAEERAYAEGYLRAESILGTFVEFAFSPFIAPKPIVWDTAFLPRIRASFLFDDSVKAWAKGVQKGMKAKLGDKMTLKDLGRDFSVDDLLASCCIPDLRGLLCSSFVAWDDRSREDAHLIGRNLDYLGTPKMTAGTMVIVHAPLGQKNGWVSIGWAGMAGCLTGISDQGVSVAVHDVYTKARPGKHKFTPRVLAVQEIIETAKPQLALGKSLGEKLGQLEFAVGCNLMVSWRSAQQTGACVIEFDSSNEVGKHATVRASNRSFVVCSNHHRLRSDKGHDCNRFASLMKGKSLSGAKSLDFAEAWKLIESASNKLTIYRNVIDLESGRFELDRRRVPRGPYAKRSRFNIKKLLAAAKL